ncbi:winged helix-turn-helix domain-containing protein [Micromonospora sp. CPCC 205539]|uniref:ArsR/SmtB family transcription factor n=1 Tax=Micromonospora sp. CPCC 205539 TaxID=3122408 RepID=UPI002FF057DA
MLRIHFSRADLALIRFAPGADWFWEVALSIHQLRLRHSHPWLAWWKRSMRHQLHPAGGLLSKTAPIIALSPPRGYFPDFLTPPDHGFESGIEAILSTPRRQLRQEIGLLAESHTRIRADLHGLGQGQPAALAALGTALRTYREQVLAPIWNQASAAVAADLQRRLRHLAAGGWAQVLDTLHPQARYADGSLQITTWGVAGDSDLHLDGRGLTLIPSYFKETRQLMVLADFDLPPVLVYPVDPVLRVLADLDHTPLAALIGTTRSRILELTTGRNTSEIARLADISVPAASKHLAVLRQNNAITSVRRGGMVIHHTTALGMALLEGGVTAQL